MTKYIAEIKPLNADKIGTAAHGQATFDLTADHLTIDITMHDTPANTQHWEHFHGFPTEKAAQVAGPAQDANGDGYIDLPETEPVSGTTMVPFNDDPAAMDIPNDKYPVADKNGDYHYTRVVSLADLTKKFKAAFNDTDLNLAQRVVYVHGVPDSVNLPATVAGAVGPYDAHVTLPIAAGKIIKVD
ncbi:hypothetical protein RA086_11630 [Lactiplantibacillus sp. WILCCON 0030]|uniref:Uncharacterized protein n=1 Tax=Lactiplantibacillus brownii TaxID=3069269 RepID=A0ABU1ABG1_9LACO|nr:hypothetical protein [Lactiplantibacillus brownii]MDQ7938260.1 hypothetical protein [Lactiplantibacillus brownii]